MSNNWPPSPTTPPLLSRRHFLANTAGGLGSVALAWLLNRESARGASTAALASAPAPHFPAKAKRIVQIFCCGGVSHLDTFDYKPGLEQMNGPASEGSETGPVLRNVLSLCSGLYSGRPADTHRFVDCRPITRPLSRTSSADPGRIGERLHPS